MESQRETRETPKAEHREIQSQEIHSGIVIERYGGEKPSDLESYRETWIKERPPELESCRERQSGKKPRDGVSGRQRRERRQREDSQKESPRRVEIPPRQSQGDTERSRYSPRDSHRETRRDH